MWEVFQTELTDMRDLLAESCCAVQSQYEGGVKMLTQTAANFPWSRRGTCCFKKNILQSFLCHSLHVLVSLHAVCFKFGHEKMNKVVLVTGANR